MKYHRVDDGHALIYSVGPDGTDDNGVKLVVVVSAEANSNRHGGENDRRVKTTQNRVPKNVPFSVSPDLPLDRSSVVQELVREIKQPKNCGAWGEGFLNSLVSNFRGLIQNETPLRLAKISNCKRAMHPIAVGRWRNSQRSRSPRSVGRAPASISGRFDLGREPGPSQAAKRCPTPSV